MKKSKAPGLGLSRRGKKAINTNQRLLTITENERQLLLGERVVLILEKSSKVEDYNIHLTDEKTDFLEIPKRLNQFRSQDCPLWTKSSVLWEPHELESYQQKLVESNRVKQLNVNRSSMNINLNPEYLNKGAIKNSSLRIDDKSSSTISVVAVNKSSLDKEGLENSTNSNSEDANDSDVSRDMFESDPEPEPEIEVVTAQTPTTKVYPSFQSSQKSSQNKDPKQFPLPRSSIMSNNSTFDDFETPKRMKENFFPRISLLESNGKSSKIIQNQTKSSSSSVADWRPPALSKSDHTDLAQDLLSLFLEKIDADVTVYGREEKAIRAHKLILKARCPKLLKEIIMERTSKLGRKKEVIPLTCFSHTSVKSLLCYIYSGRILPPAFNVKDLSQKDLDEIVELGVKYGLDLSLKPEPQISCYDGSQVTTQRVKTNEISIQTDKHIDDKATQTISTVTVSDYDDDKFDEPIHECVRVDERAHEYRERSCSPYANDNLNDAFGNSGILSEESFNDKVFANKLVDDSVVRKSRKTWSEKSYKFSSNSNESDTDSIIILGDDGSDGVKHDWNNGAEVRDKSIRNHSPLMRPASQPMQSTWNHSDFFANLPSDDQLLNLPPTSPSGSNTYTGCSPIRLPRSPARSFCNDSPPESLKSTSATSKKQCRKRKAKKNSDEQLEQQLQPTKKPGHRVCRPRGKEPRFDDEYFQLDSDEDDGSNVISERVYTQSFKKKKPGPPPKNRTRTPVSSSSQGHLRSPSASQGQNRNVGTPMLNYSLIDTPILKKELKRYGLKPLPRSKAKIMLRHIYQETHK